MQPLYGWAGKILKVDLTAMKTTSLATAEYSDRFLGGLGIAEKIYWDESSPEFGAFDPANPLIIMTGPLAGTIAPSAPRMVVCGKSPCTYPERFVIASAAGFFPAQLKKAGFDGIVVTGKAHKPVYLSVVDGTAEIRDAGHLWGCTTSRTRRELGQDKAKVLSIGPGSEQGSRIGCISIDMGGNASMGFGSVMGSKNLKAIAVRGNAKIPVADPEGVKKIRDKLLAMTGEGYYNIYGNPVPVPGNEVVKKVHCHGCPVGCWRTLQRRESGLEGIRKCQTATYYAKWDRQLNGNITDITFQATEMANDYSLCVTELLFLMLWLERSRDKGILTEEQTGLPLSKMGSLEFLKAFLDMLSQRKDFGAVLADGALRASGALGEESRKITADFLNQAGRPFMTYGPKSFILSAPIFATEQRPFITELHEICHPLAKWALWLKTKGKGSYVSTEVLRNIADTFWGGRQAVDFTTYEGKAPAARIIQNRQYAKECLILCDFVWPLHDDAGTEGHVGDPTLESRLLSAVVGRDYSEQDLDRIGERIFNLNRAIQLRDGRRGRKDDTLSELCFIAREEPPADIFDMYNPERLLPGKGDELIPHKNKAVDREGFEKLMDEYYALRGWDVQSGLIKKETLDKLDLTEVAEELRSRGQLAA